MNATTDATMDTTTDATMYPIMDTKVVAAHNTLGALFESVQVIINDIEDIRINMANQSKKPKTLLEDYKCCDSAKYKNLILFFFTLTFFVFFGLNEITGISIRHRNSQNIL
ncbi:hypothetical protein DFJ63DRAFT_315309 [Scheffersomyces coipomensis]|uniref:uncharacterized protein n=1 Tax=Scheffersomyces coipomensis TaxID=1788519 RepID=UPI00315C84F8